MGLKRLELFTDYELRQELKVSADQPTRDYILKLLQERSEQRVKGNKELFKDDQGRTIPGYMTTSELITEIDAGPEDEERYASLAVEAIRRADRRAFPSNRVPALVIFASKAPTNNIVTGEFIDDPLQQNSDDL